MLQFNKEEMHNFFRAFVLEYNANPKESPPEIVPQEPPEVDPHEPPEVVPQNPPAETPNHEPPEITPQNPPEITPPKQSCRAEPKLNITSWHMLPPTKTANDKIKELADLIILRDQMSHAHPSKGKNSKLKAINSQIKKLEVETTYDQQIQALNARINALMEENNGLRNEIELHNKPINH